MRKLVPALYHLRRSRLLSERFTLIGVGRDGQTDAQYREKLSRDLREFVSQPLDVGDLDWLLARASYVSGGFDDEATYRNIGERLTLGAGEALNAVFYLATPPSLFGPIGDQLGAGGLVDESSAAWRRIIVEKPFGRDLETAQALNRRMLSVVQEHQIYRIDHYLGKETVQNIMALRFGNGIFEPIWNRRYVDHVQICVAETVGVEQRGGYYDTAGALRDMLQNHLFQLLAVTTMEPPGSFRAEAVRNERLKVLQAVRPFTGNAVTRDVVRGQYTSGTLSGQAVPGYRSEPRVAPQSDTETYVALKVLIDTWRWADVPFYLRTGKRLPSRVTEIAIQFKQPPLALFRDTPAECVQPNWLVLRIQPREGIALQFEAKVPGPRVQLGAVKMDFCYVDHFGEAPSTGYETLLYDCMIGDATLFHRADIVEAGWALVAPVMAAWQDGGPAVRDYPAGSWGPSEADALIERDGRAWRDPVA
jgi:glucose-6-phosphate 1-dehydrogenase